ncbi:MAG: aminotransferase class V-fold PLP-dependent enzyme [Clostridium sp.]|nr:aminotransferase class V-fold PLP-dependent enzyme [Clostridium sp.]
MKKEVSIYERLTALAHSDSYPYHMPGHKRNPKAGLPGGLAELDITEIEDFDNLHHAQGILKDAMERAAALYGADRTYFLINGSTCGVLAAISSVVSRGDTLILGRNAHMSAYHAAYLRECRVASLYPELLKEYGVYGAVSCEETERLLRQYPEAKAVCITSPTYDGFFSDVEKIAEVVHAYDKILIVDEAHGAHFGLDMRMPQNSIDCGADLVIHSLHKTLPSLTQTALLHIKGSRVNRERLERFLRIYQSSSPSYVLMGSIDRCIRQMQEHRGEWFDSFFARREKLIRELSTLRFLRAVYGDAGSARNEKESRGAESACGAVSGMEPSKLMIFCDSAGMTGVELQRILLTKYHLQMEMAGEDYVLAILTVMDTDEGYARLAKALKEIDEGCERKAAYGIRQGSRETRRAAIRSLQGQAERAPLILTDAMEESAVEAVPLENARGRIVTEFLYAYPPGISVILPGETMTEEVITLIQGYRDKGLTLQGPADETLRTIRCVKKWKVQ